MKVQQPFIGHSSGTLAGMVYQTYNGATYMHAKTTNYHYPDTEPQQKVQGLYWDIMRQFQVVYRGASKAFPKVMPCNWNVFDIWAAGIFQAAQTYPRVFKASPSKWFGQDKRQSVKLQFTDYTVDFADNTLKVDYIFNVVEIRRKFTPTQVHTIVVNKTMQLLQYAFAEYVTNHVTLMFQGLEGWSARDELRIYVALQNDIFFTNFYRLLP